MKTVGIDKTVGDMYLAAVYLAYGLKLNGVDRKDPHHQRFSFSGKLDYCYVLDDDYNPIKIDNPSFEQIELNYASKTLLFPPEYPECIRKIKSLIHAD